eukprot:CAMPEP_0203899720 /NCGR_PEP_ID=MMETSP0359-20131031/42094_1 /ASSEMBLY_ACC=CAM_ASM_000338 /TAXON_ID=268821 /ORGANISM="Scrippsiella Hangoei, Strain SHTV-5" /LENGTH=114 /DNA_ID=CAMNT_0050823029 /DNA_START=42 /DNA_END=386 /DNA_ORIENTATION=+
MEALARTVLVERKHRVASMPVVLETTCSRRHALILCQALARAQQIRHRWGYEGLGLSCTAQVAYAKSVASSSSADASASEHSRLGSVASDSASSGGRQEPRLLRIFVWTSDYVQ